MANEWESTGYEQVGDSFSWFALQEPHRYHWKGSMAGCISGDTLISIQGLLVQLHVVSRTFLAAWSHRRKAVPYLRPWASFSLCLVDWVFTFVLVEWYRQGLLWLRMYLANIRNPESRHNTNKDYKPFHWFMCLPLFYLASLPYKVYRYWLARLPKVDRSTLEPPFHR